MTCPHCGASTPESSRFCATCGQTLDEVPGEFAPPVAQMPVMPVLPQSPPTTRLVYAGFWRRVLATIIDTVIFAPFAFIFAALIAMVIPMANRSSAQSEAMVGILIAGYVLMLGVAVLGGWLYYTLMESSRHRATLGKMVAGISVTDLEGNQISFARANGRYFAKSLSGMIFYIGFIMVGFTEKKQGLHDIIAGCLVVRKTL